MRQRRHTPPIDESNAAQKSIFLLFKRENYFLRANSWIRFKIILISERGNDVGRSAKKKKKRRGKKKKKTEFEYCGYVGMIVSLLSKFYSLSKVSVANVVRY